MYNKHADDVMVFNDVYSGLLHSRVWKVWLEMEDKIPVNYGSFTGPAVGRRICASSMLKGFLLR